MNNIKGKELRILRAVFTLLLSIMMCMSSIAPAMAAYAEDDNTQGADTPASFDVPEDDSESSDDAKPAEEESTSDNPQPSEDAQPNEDEATNDAPEKSDSDAQQSDESLNNNEDNSSSDDAANNDSSNNDADNADDKALNPQVHNKPAMLLSNPAMLSNAPDDAIEDGVAAIGDTKYASLQDAVDAAKDGDAIKLLADIELDKTVVVEGKSITIIDDGSARTVKNNEGISVPLFKVSSGAELTLNGSSNDNLKLLGGSSERASNSATVLVVDGVANIKATNIDGGTIKKGHNVGAILVNSGGLLNMSGGVVENTESYQGTYGTAAIVVKEKAHFEMSGGEIRNNINYSSDLNHGGGVILAAWSPQLSTMNLSGGKITNNQSNNGGGIYITGSSKLHMTGGEVSNNKATGNYKGVGMGGGICVSGRWQGTDGINDEFIMDGGSVSGNAARTGGGIYVNSIGTYLNAGLIENNKASNNGGGVYLSVVPQILHISKAVITENTAYSIGGGVWSCPTGTVEFEVTNGVAIYDNNARGAGDDFNMQASGFLGSSSKLTLPDRMLGGGAVSWHKDGATYPGEYGDANPNVPRFDPDNPGKALHYNGHRYAATIKAVASDAAIKRANEEATLFIRGNSAVRGGGIGTNGGVSLPDMNYKEWKLLVEKKWKEIAEEDQKEVKVFLKIDDEILDGVTLNADNEWKGEFTQLPDQDTIKGKDISVVEGEMVTDDEGVTKFVEEEVYAVDYEKVISEEEQTTYITVTNYPKPPVRITKKALGGDELEGAEIEIRDSEGELVDKWTSTKEAHEIVLKKGDYTLKETTAPEGYYAVSVELAFSVDGNGNAKTETAEIVDENGGRILLEGNDIVIEDPPVVKDEDEDEEEPEEVENELEDEVEEKPEAVKGVSEDEIEAEAEEEVVKAKVKGVKTGDESNLYAWSLITIVTVSALMVAIIRRRRSGNN